jgi:hypothetical protein
MKNFPGIWKAVVPISFVVAVTVLIQACALIVIEKGRFEIIFKSPQPLISKKSFEVALGKLQHLRGINYEFNAVYDNGERKHYKFDSPLPLKTKKVTVTEIGRSLSKDELTPIGTSITHHLYTPNATDVAILLAEIKK